MHGEAGAVPTVYLVIPGTIDTLTGGYIYDKRIVTELEKFAWKAVTVSLDPSFPVPTPDALAHAKECFAAIPSGSLLVIDGLALAGLVALLPAIAQRCTLIALIHHPLADETGIDVKLADALEKSETVALQQVDWIIVTSAWTQRRLMGYGIEPARVTVVEPGVDRVTFAAKKAQPVMQLLTVASITPRKGHAILVEALAELKDLHWSLRCVGSLDLDRQCAEALQQQITTAGLSDRIALLGQQAHECVCREYANADLFVLPSYLEGYGMALAEAIANGLPVVSTNSGAIPDTVPQTAARLVPPGNACALAQALRELLGNRATHAALVEGAADAAKLMPTWAHAAEKFADVLAVQAGR